MARGRLRLAAQLFTVASLAATAAHAQPTPEPIEVGTPAEGSAPPEAPPPDGAAADLAAAADAAADVANVPAPAAPPADGPSAADQAADDIDLASLGLDPASAGSGEEDKLNIYGFADFNYWAPFLPKGNVVASYLPKEHYFSFGNLNIYLARNLGASWRALSEIRFLYSPNGSEAGGALTSTSVEDPANLQRSVSWGGISIQRAYIEHDLTSKISVRAGHWLTPYGIWNLDHGSPTIIGTLRPYIVGEQFFPESQTGIDVFGSTLVGDYKLGYHATVSNGRGPASTVRNLSNDMGFGGRVEFEAPWAGSFKAGASVYAGKFVDRPTDQVSVDATGKPIDVEPVGTRYAEVAYAADAQWIHRGLHLQSEIMARQRAYDTGARPGTAATGFSPDSASWGIYGLAAYRFERFWNVMPYVQAEHYRALESSVTTQIGRVIRVWDAGLNFRPSASVVLKLSWNDAWFPDRRLDIAHFKVAMAQISWVF
ncbi:MAG: hypothetical protein K8W52_11785 [Deltaproteobacteria bacterium]|nr:hypothetical protein [Deltaproteobacteria bacterium]